MIAKAIDCPQCAWTAHATCDLRDSETPSTTMTVNRLLTGALRKHVAKAHQELHSMVDASSEDNRTEMIARMADTDFNSARRLGY